MTQTAPPPAPAPPAIPATPTVAPVRGPVPAPRGGARMRWIRSGVRDTPGRLRLLAPDGMEQLFWAGDVSVRPQSVP